MQGYQASQNFLQLSERTRRDYIGQIKIIEKQFGDFPLRALAARETRGIFKDWRESSRSNLYGKPIMRGPC